MKRFFENWHLPENLEVLFMLILGIFRLNATSPQGVARLSCLNQTSLLLQMADGSPFSLQERWMLVWETELPAQNFSPLVQRIIKTVLSMIVVVRCATTYAYVVSAMLVIFCLLRNAVPKLMLLWLLVAGIKSICMTFLEALTGVYVCSAFGKVRKACIEFFISKALEIIFATYLWGCVQNIYQDMEGKAEGKRAIQLKEQMYMQRMDFCRQRARSLVDESTLYKTACLNNFEFKDVPQIILQMLRTDSEMSQDSLLGPGMMLASVSNLGSFDHLKTSQSLGELGFMDLGTTQVVGLDEDDNLSHQEKALRFLKLTQSDVSRIRLNKSCIENDIYTIDRDMWNRVEASGTRLNKPKQTRTQIFIRDIPQMEACDEKSKIRKKSFDYKFGFSFSTLFNERQSSFDEEQDEEFIFSHEEEDEDDEPTELFMSNINEGVIIHPNRLGIVLKKLKGNAYAELYRQDFMSVIGPEVFDKACKLPKVTSLTKLSVISQPKTSVSLPVITDLQGNRNLENDLKEKISESSSEELQPSKEDEDDVSEPSDSGKVQLNVETDSIEEDPEDLPRLIFNLQQQQLPESDSKETAQDNSSEDSERSKTTDEDSLHSLTSVDNCETTATKSNVCFRKRRIIIRRIGKRKGINWFWNKPSSRENYNSPDPCLEVDSKKDFQTEKTEIPREISQEPEKPSLYQEKSVSGMDLGNDNQKHFDGYNQQMYFLTELLQKPLLDVLITYYDLKKRVHVQKKSSVFFKKQNIEFFNMPLQNYSPNGYNRALQSLDFTPNGAKVWKSKVLKIAEARNREKSVVTVRSVINIIKRESVLRRLFKYEYARLMNKRKGSDEASNEIILSQINGHRFEYKKFNVLSSTENTSDYSITSKRESEISLNPNIDAGKCENCTREEKDGEKTQEIPQIPNKVTNEVANKDTKVEEVITETHEQETQSECKVLVTDPEGESLCSQESDEPISLYYSKAANLASPLFDMKRFIYPDHIHYSYKHVKKKGFDVEINGGFPLLVRESLTMGTPVEMGSSKNPEFEITRRPMDLSFASTNAFAEWQTNDQNDVDAVLSEKRAQKCNNSSCKKERNSSVVDLNKNKKTKKTKRSKKNSERIENRSSLKYDFIKSKPKPYERSFNNIKYLYSTKDYALIEKLLKMHVQFNSQESDNMGKPVQISSTQLHSNKGRVNSTYNPAIFLQENKSRAEKKKLETQEERTKDMFARLEREALLQSKNVQKSFGPNRST